MVSTLDDLIYNSKENSIECSHEIFFQDANNIKKLAKESIDLVITSPPYWSIKDYGNTEQIGFNDSLPNYMNKLISILKMCVNALKPESKLCINIGDQFLRANTPPKKVYQIIPLHSMIINQLLTECDNDLVYIGSIQWEKVSHSQTSGGGQIMGSYPYPKSGYFFVNREYIAIFRKLGVSKKNQKPDPELKLKSRLTLDDWRTYFKDTWKFAPADQKTHMAMFPEELPARLIKMYSFVGDMILDPFLGSGTTSLASAKLGRNSKGFEIGFECKDGTSWKELIKNKIKIPKTTMKYPIEITNDNGEKIIEENSFDIFNEYIFH